MPTLENLLHVYGLERFLCAIAQAHEIVENTDGVQRDDGEDDKEKGDCKHRRECGENVNVNRYSGGVVGRPRTRFCRFQQRGNFFVWSSGIFQFGGQCSADFLFQAFAHVGHLVFGGVPSLVFEASEQVAHIVAVCVCSRPVGFGLGLQALCFGDSLGHYRGERLGIFFKIDRLVVHDLNQ